MMEVAGVVEARTEGCGKGSSLAGVQRNRDECHLT
jgi:hypothetical protein